MVVLSLKTELDVAELLLAHGWLPEDVNSVLVFPLPNAIFHALNSKSYLAIDRDVANAVATPTTVYRARQLLESAGWQDSELDSLLKPYLYGGDAWANQTMHIPTDPQLEHAVPPLPKPLRWVNPALGSPSLSLYRRTMALKRMGSLALVIILVITAVVWLG